MKTLMHMTLAVLLTAPMLSAKDELPFSLQKASDVIGKKVENPAGESLGKIEDVVLDASNGRIAYAVLSFGGFLGIGDKLFAIPWQALKENREKKVCVLAADKDYLKGAPGFDKKDWPDMSDISWRREVHLFYKVPFSEADGSAPLALTELKRESVQLPLSLRQGLTLAYEVSCKQEGKDRYVRLQVLSMTGDEATVEAICTGEGADKGQKSNTACTFIVSKDGAVRPATEKDKQPGSTDGKDASEREMALLFVQHVFGQGLHAVKLEPGRDYTMPGSFHSIHETSSIQPAAARETGTPQRPAGTTEGVRTTPSSATSSGSHAMRFEGTANCHGQTVAVFNISHGKGLVTPPGTRNTPGTTSSPETVPARPDESRSTVAPPGDACSGCVGKAAYRTSDGFLEAMAFDGATLRRIDGNKPSLGN